MTTYTPHGQVPEALPAIQRFEVVDCIDSKHVPAVIPKPHGPWVRYDDHIAALAGGQATAAQQGVAYAELTYKQVLGSKNCMQCCVSYMLGLPLESVPDFATDGGWELFSDFAESQGYAAVMLPGNREFEADYLASGTTERGTSHMVVMNDGKLVHDPHPSNAGLVEMQCVWLLTKKATPQWHHDERAAFEASAKAFTSNVSFERDGTDYADMTASLLWHGWKLRASHGQAPAMPECLTCNDHGAVGNILTAEPCPDCTRKAAPAAVAGPSEAVAYLDIGTGGYLDIGTDLTDEALSRLPKGRRLRRLRTEDPAAGGQEP